MRFGVRLIAQLNSDQHLAPTVVQKSCSGKSLGRVVAYERKCQLSATPQTPASRKFEMLTYGAEDSI